MKVRTCRILGDTLNTLGRRFTTGAIIAFLLGSAVHGIGDYKSNRKNR